MRHSKQLVLLILACTMLCAAEPAPDRPQVTITTSMGAITVELLPEIAPVTVANFLALAEGGKGPEGQVIDGPFYDGLTFHRVIAGFMLQGGCPAGDGSSGPGYQFHDEINAVSLGLDREAALSDGALHPQCEYMQRQFMQALVLPRMRARGIDEHSPQDAQQQAFEAVLRELDGQVSLQQFYEALGYRYDAELPPSPRPLRAALCMANAGPNTNGSQFFINLVDTPHLTGKHTVFGRVVEGMAVVEAISAVPVDDRHRPRSPVRIISVRRVVSEGAPEAPPGE